MPKTKLPSADFLDIGIADIDCNCFLKVLNGPTDASQGGVLLFVTDGKQDCNGPDKDYIDTPEIKNRIKNSKVRIITIAFG